MPTFDKTFRAILMIVKTFTAYETIKFHLSKWSVFKSSTINKYIMSYNATACKQVSPRKTMPYGNGIFSGAQLS